MLCNPPRMPAEGATSSHLLGTSTIALRAGEGSCWVSGSLLSLSPGGGGGGGATPGAGRAGKGRAVQMRFADLPASAGSAPGLPAHGGTGGYRHYCSRKRHREAGTGLWREWGWGLDSRS